MNFVYNYFMLLLLAATAVVAAPVDKRFYQPTSPVFSLIAHHNGSVFQYNLVKFDGTELVLDADDKAFFGRIRANNGYILNLPKAVQTNSLYNASSDQASTTSVIVNKHNQLVTTESPTNASQNFGVSHSLLTYKGSNKFVACPILLYKQSYGIFFQGNVTNSSFICPQNATGYPINLMVQIDATLNFNPDTNKNTFYKRFNAIVNRALTA